MTNEIRDEDIVRIVRANDDLLEMVCSKHEATRSRIEELERELAKLKGSSRHHYPKTRQSRKPNIDMGDKIDMIVEAIKCGNSTRRSIMNNTCFSRVQYDIAIVEAVRSGRVLKNGDRASTFYTLNVNGSP